MMSISHRVHLSIVTNLQVILQRAVDVPVFIQVFQVVADTVRDPVPASDQILNQPDHQFPKPQIHHD